MISCDAAFALSGCPALFAFPFVQACPLALGAAHCLQAFLPSDSILAF